MGECKNMAYQGRDRKRTGSVRDRGQRKDRVRTGAGAGTGTGVRVKG